jgi:hypothetical protein
VAVGCDISDGKIGLIELKGIVSLQIDGLSRPVGGSSWEITERQGYVVKSRRPAILRQRCNRTQLQQVIQRQGRDKQ